MSDTPSPIVVVGSANADIYIEVNNMPKSGETIDGKLTLVGPGGKGSNQAGACAKSFSTPNSIKFIGKLGNDQHASMFLKEYESIGLDFSLGETLPTASTGQAYIFLDSQKQNSIIIDLGANELWEHDTNGNVVFTSDQTKALTHAKCVLLQREIPDSVNLAVAQLCKSHNVPVFLDVGGKAGAIDTSVLPYLYCLTMNETELGRLVGKTIEIKPVSSSTTQTQTQTLMPKFDISEILTAAQTLYTNHSLPACLITLGGDGALFIEKGELVSYHPGYAPKELVDTTGAGDCFRANFAVAYVEGQSIDACMKFAAAASTLCIGKKGTLISMPMRTEIDAFLNTVENK